MKVDIRDADTLKAVRPSDMAAYLRARGWIQVAFVNGRAGIWRWHDRPDAEVLLPGDRAVADFPARVADVLYSLAAIEDRSQLEILLDISQSESHMPVSMSSAS